MTPLVPTFPLVLNEVISWSAFKTHRWQIVATKCRKTLSLKKVTAKSDVNLRLLPGLKI